MQYLNASQIATLHNEFQRSVYSGMTDAQRLAYILTPEQVANPTSTAPQIQAPITLDGMVGCLTDQTNGSAYKMVSFVNYSIIRDDILSQNKDYILHWVAVLQPAGIITSGEASTINSYVNRTISDPTWTATLTEPTPASRLFPNTNWIGSDGSFTATPTIDDVAAAR